MCRYAELCPFYIGRMFKLIIITIAITLCLSITQSLRFIRPYAVRVNFGFRESFRADISLSASNQKENQLIGGDPSKLLVPIDLNYELKTSFMAYAMSTILSRALPDAVSSNMFMEGTKSQSIISFSVMD